MKALISPLQDNFVVQVEPNNLIFEVAEPFYWQDCSDTIIAYQYKFIDSQYVPYTPAPYIQSAEENKATATALLSATDWVTIGDIGNPQMCNPYLFNQAEFIAYRNSVRQYAVYPTAGVIAWEQVPIENWVKV